MCKRFKEGMGTDNVDLCGLFGHVKAKAGFANQRAAKADASVDTACPGAMLGPSPSLTYTPASADKQPKK